MKALKVAATVSLALLWSTSMLAQDPVKVDGSHYKVLIDNASVRVLKIS